MNHTSIIATIGPASIEEAVLRDILQAGVDVARLNFSWGDHAEHRDYIHRIRAVASATGIRIPIVADLSGPRIQETGGHHINEAEHIITEKDLHDVTLCAELHVEYVAQSYVGSGEDIALLRTHLTNAGCEARIIAKVERKAALENIEGILASADAIMIARGDLGHEIPLEEIPFIETSLIEKARAAGKPVIVATEMMPSMIESDHPTRSDVTDVAYAVMNGADAVMLSNETTIGKHPREVVAMMERIIREAEMHAPPFERRAF